MRFLKTEENTEVIRFADCTLRKTAFHRWKVTQPKGIFTLHQESQTRWRYVFGSSKSGTQKRGFVDAFGMQEAVQKISPILFGIASSEEAAQSPSIAEALEQSRLATHCEPYHQHTLKKHGGYFLAWCRRKKLFYWHELKPQHVKEYAFFTLSKGCCRSTALHYLEPVRLADRWIMETCPDAMRHITIGFRLPSRAGLSLSYQHKKKKVYLSAANILDWLAWLQNHSAGPSLVLGIALQGLMGLQLQEVTRLTWDRIDLEKGTITIEEDRRLNPSESGIKNIHRVRCLPMPRFVCSLIRDLFPEDPVGKGCRKIIDAPEWKAYSHRVSRALRRWNSMIKLAPKDLRNTLPTEAERGGWMSIWVRRYFGHAPANMIEKSYLAEIEAHEQFNADSDAFVERLRREVTSQIDSLIEKCKIMQPVVE